MAEDHLKSVPVARVAGWYRRLADAWSKGTPELQPDLAGTFLRAYLGNRNPQATVEFDAPVHLKASPVVAEVQRYHRDVFLTTRKARLKDGVEKWAGILPRVKGAKGFTKWDAKSPLRLEYESLCDIAPNHVAIVRVQKLGSTGDRDIFGSLRGFQLKSEVAVMAQQPSASLLSVQFTSWQCSGTDRYDWNYSERLTFVNPDYGSTSPEAVRPQDQQITVFHSNAKRLEDAGLAAPFNVRLRPWVVTDAGITAAANLDLNRTL